MASTDRFSVNIGYDNFFLENEFADQFTTHLDLAKFFKVDNNLIGAPGMVVKINRYVATNGTQKLTVAQGNSQSITASCTTVDYEILLAQNRFEFYDEEQLSDPNVVIAGMRHTATDMFNTMNADVIAELNGTGVTQTVTVTNHDYFSAFVDAQALLGVETTDAGAPATFAFIHPTDLAALRKALKDDLKYNESYVRTGYVGTCAGTPIYVTKAATAGTINLATSEAVTLFVKSGTEIEQQREPNTRKNSIYTRKYYLAALTNATKAVKIS